MAYTLSDLISEVQRRASDSSFSSTEITDYLNDTNREVVARHTWPFMEQSADTTLVVGTVSYSQQADYDVSLDAYLIDPDDTTQVYSLKYIPQDEFFSRHPNPSTSENNIPTEWTIFAGSITFNVPPSKAYTLRQRYYKVPTTLSSSGDEPNIPERYKEVLIRGTLARVEERRDNFDFASIHRNEFENLLEDMASRLIPQQFGTPSQLRTARTRQYGSF